MNEKALMVIKTELRDQGAAYPTSGALVMMNALKAARIAVVELPKPNDFGSYSMLWAGESESAIALSSGEVRISGFDTMSVDIAREIAAAVLAAADAAEAVSHD